MCNLLCKCASTVALVCIFSDPIDGSDYSIYGHKLSINGNIKLSESAHRKLKIAKGIANSPFLSQGNIKKTTAL